MKGLSTTEANEQLKFYGYNELPSAKSKNMWQIALEVVKEPMFILLITCGALYMIIGNYKEGSVLLSTILIIIFITFYQYQKTEKALHALKKLSSPRTLVMRDGKEIRIPGREVVPNDIIIINEGDRIAADAKLLEAINLIVDESLLTGESIPVTKNIQTSRQVFSGTLVIQGKGIAIVKSTGIKTEFGKIGVSLQNIEQDVTRLQKEMKTLIKNLFIIGALISAGIVIAFYFTRGNFIQSLLNGLASAMAILPEEFPVVLTIFLALGAWRLSKKNVLTRKPSAIETLGSATVLCSDKTGTITQNKMAVTVVYTGSELFKIENSISNKNEIRPLLTAAYRASQNNSIDPMEKAINTTHENIVEKNEADEILIKEYPLSKDLLAMTRVLESTTDGISVSTKGAPETILKLCKLPEQDMSRHLLAVRKMAEQGYRVIGVAKSKLDSNQLPENQQGFDFTFIGLIGLHDPIRPEVPMAIKECNEAGIKVIMITGDFPATAKSIANQIGLDSKNEIITGEELKKINDEELKKRIMHVNIFARVIPEQKLRIIQALKANNEVVAMTGDGVNDAPALKAADIGIAMGNKGTDVAREASSLVLLDDNFASIVSAIRSGRRIYDNLQKAMSYILAIHIPIIGLTLLPAFITNLPLLLMPLHIVFMELIIDPVCSIAYESEQEEKRIMQHPPRNPNELFFGKQKILSSLLNGFFVLGMVIGVYLLSIKEGHTNGEVRAIAFSSLIIGNVFLILTTLSKTHSFIAVFIEKNMAAILILTISVILLLIIISTPYLQHIFSFEFPGYKHFTISILSSACVLFLLETIKYVKHKKYFFRSS